MKIIFNGDDFGLSKGVNLGIVEAYKNGPLRSTTIMATMPGFEHALGLSRENPGLKIGVHLNLTSGKSLGSGYNSITDENGNFLKLHDFEKLARANELAQFEIEEEFELQIQKVLDAGIEPDHFDSHHHIHMLPRITDVYVKLANKYGVKARYYNQETLFAVSAPLKTTSCFSDNFYGDVATTENLMSLINRTKGNSLEIMCHPAYADYSLQKLSSYNTKRTHELEILTGSEIKDFIQNRGYTLCSFSDL